MSVVSWILDVVLALAFLAAGGMKLAQPRTALAEKGMAGRRRQRRCRSGHRRPRGRRGPRPRAAQAARIAPVSAPSPDRPRGGHGRRRRWCTSAARSRPSRRPSSASSRSWPRSSASPALTRPPPGGWGESARRVRRVGRRIGATPCDPFGRQPGRPRDSAGLIRPAREPAVPTPLPLDPPSRRPYDAAPAACSSARRRAASSRIALSGSVAAGAAPAAERTGTAASQASSAAAPLHRSARRRLNAVITDVPGVLVGQTQSTDART